MNFRRHIKVNLLVSTRMHGERKLHFRNIFIYFDGGVFFAEADATFLWLAFAATEEEVTRYGL